MDRFATVLHGRNIISGDFVGVFTTNSIEMVVTIYALSKLGCVAALINTNLRGTVQNHTDACQTETNPGEHR